jgi:RNA polymerase sigma-70 factor (ECF subfamily)
VPWEEAIRGEERAVVRRALAELPPEQRRVVEARIDQGKSFAVIAAEQGLPLGTVLTRMRLALEKLRRALGEDR